MSAIALIDYGAGNLTSVKKALRAIDADVFVPTDPAQLQSARGLIVPGVGHFGVTQALQGVWIDTIRRRVIEGQPLLGICLGMQWLFEASDEAQDCPGLGVLPGRCRRLGDAAAGSPRLKIPHVGWNSLDPCRADSIVDEVPEGAQVYFTHSYAAPVTADTVTTTEHGDRFASIVQRGRIAGVQFHPEKSGPVGLRILRNFVAGIG